MCTEGVSTVRWRAWQRQHVGTAWSGPPHTAISEPVQDQQVFVAIEAAHQAVYTARTNSHSHHSCRQREERCWRLIAAALRQTRCMPARYLYTYMVLALSCLYCELAVIRLVEVEIALSRLTTCTLTDRELTFAAS